MDIFLKIRQWFFIGLRINWNFSGRYARPGTTRDLSDLSACTLENFCHNLYNVLTENLLCWALSFTVNSLTARTLHCSTFFAWNTFPFDLPTCLGYFSISFRPPLQIHLLWLGTLTTLSQGSVPLQRAPLLIASHCWVMYSSVSPLFCEVLRNTLSHSSLYSQGLASHVTRSRHSIMDKEAELGFKVRSFLSGTNLTFLHAAS